MDFTHGRANNTNSAKEKELKVHKNVSHVE